MSCWAKPLGGCDEKLSREHIISDGLWSGPSITVHGFSWCAAAPVTVGRAAVTAKILCRAHNSQLSPADQGGIAAFQALRQAGQLVTRRRRIPPREWMLHCFTVDGGLLERWFLKTAINVSALGPTKTRWLHDRASPDVPSLFVEAAFGLMRLPAPMGLYAAASPGETVHDIEAVELAPLLFEDGSIAAFLFRFVGVRFLLSLVNLEMPRVLKLPHARSPDWDEGRMLRHLKRIDWNIGPWRSHFLDFRWPESDLDHFGHRPQR